MSMRTLISTGLLAALTTLSFAASAADVRVSCERRTNRSKVSVDGNNLAAGSYKAVVRSGTNSVGSNFATADGDEAEFDFDSSRADIAEGATPIAAGFIVDGRVRAWLVNASNQRVTPVVEAICRVRR